MIISFNRPYATGNELAHVAAAAAGGHWAGDGPFTAKCRAWLEARTGTRMALLTHSCTAALEMAAILADLKPGDEVIMPSYSFPSTANAVVLRGATPVFVDIRPDTLNIDEARIEPAITAQTRAILVIHYAGVACEMDAIMAIARRHGLLVIEDAAHAVMAGCKGRPLGSIGHLGVLSFHATKNLTAGEGGALLVNEERFCRRAEIVRVMGTNRSQFLRGEVDKYTWVDQGSSCLPSELTAAFLWAQLEVAEEITRRRVRLWQAYHTGCASLERDGILRRPVVPRHCQHNGHLYYLLLPNARSREVFMARMKERGIGCAFHYQPLHNSPAGQRFGRCHGGLSVTEHVTDCLVRLPLWPGLEDHQQEVMGALTDCLAGLAD
ncbi:MAG: dTDP-4-amino-4,6-dideoxygalactose transaminase [Magnetococcales bacterium]|nr:dTDP-4-amino-4,6-dideoxygalactose transaminase [Magnetococcales bacterium]